MAAAVKIAKSADVTVLVIGEDFDLSGEARSRSDLELPASQLELAKRILATGKPVVVVLANGRPLALPWLAENAPVILESWMLGSISEPAPISNRPDCGAPERRAAARSRLRWRLRRRPTCGSGT